MKEVLKGIIAATLISSGAGSANAQDLEQVKIGYYPGTMLSALVLVAEGKGFYRDAGIEPTLISTASGPIANSNIASGAIDIALQPPSNIGVARDQGLDQVIIAGNLYMPWVVMARSSVDTPHLGAYPDIMGDLKGLTWGPYARGSDSELFLRVMASDAGLDLDNDITWVGVGGPATGLPALQSGQIQVYLALDPAPIVASSQGYGKTVVDLRKGQGPEDFSDTVYQAMVTKRTTAQERPEMIRKIVAAHEKTFCWINEEENFAEFLSFMQTKLPVGNLDDVQYEGMVRDGMTLLTMGFPASSIEVWNKMLLKADAIKTPLVTDDLFWETVSDTDPSCD
jgi:ABC-type nitrate/sulfonate/bicarbonate transport system substrate-binding protein